MRLTAYRTQFVSDGETIFAKITDEATRDIDQQIVSRTAPAKLHLQDIYGDGLLAQVIGSGLARYPVQLELLLDDNPLASALGPESTRETLSPASADGEMCDRVAVNSPEGTYTFWIDQQSRLLRRLEFPTDHMQPENEVVDQVADLSLMVDFRSASFGNEIAADTFAFNVLDDAKQVRYFVPPPQPLPTDLFGKQPGEFEFKSIGEGTASAESLKGKVAVLLWFNNHPSGQASATALNEVAKKFAENDKIAFLGICTDPSSVSDLQIENLMRVWRVEMPIARDLAATGRDVFQIPVWPTLVVLDAQGRVQLFEAGHIEAVYEALPKVLTDIAGGENLAGHILAAYETELEQYDRDLATAAGRANRPWSRSPRRRLRPAANRTRIRSARHGQMRRSSLPAIC